MHETKRKNTKQDQAGEDKKHNKTWNENQQIWNIMNFIKASQTKETDVEEKTTWTGQEWTRVNYKTEPNATEANTARQEQLNPEEKRNEQKCKQNHNR